MNKTEEEFFKRINETFRVEAEEHLSAFSSGLIELEKTQAGESSAEIIEAMFREIHSLKGAARSIDQKDVESICQPLESVFSALKHKQYTLSPFSFDLFYKTQERLSRLITESGSGQTAADRQSQRELIRQLKEIAAATIDTGVYEEPKQSREIQAVESCPVSSSENEAGTGMSKSVRPISTATVRIRLSILEPLLLQAEELTQAKKAINQRINELKEINTWVTGWKSESFKHKGQHSVTSSSLWNELNEDNETSLNKLENRLTELTRSMERDQYSLHNMVDNHLEAMRQIILLPISSMVEALPGMVRKISREQNKEIEFEIRGAELEIDKRILEELKDPLIHLIRNSIDHGIGHPQERILQKKPSSGTIILAFTSRGSGMIEITLSDDGKGINDEQILKSAVKSGILSKEASEKLDPGEILSLIYQSGVSTSSVITDISGRGLGLSIVREKVEKLNGILSVKTEINVGTTFNILLPITVATFRGILVGVDEFMFILPTINVERVIKVEPELIQTVANHATVQIGGQILSVADLGEVLGLPEYKHAGSGKTEAGMGNSNQISIVIVVSGEQRIAFKVDHVIDEQQLLVKGLGKLLNRVRNISSATILGSGRVVPVLHIPDLMKSALRSAEKFKVQNSIKKPAGKRKKILVADDSITSRTLIKNILETSGYQVFTAIDGMDAFIRAHSDEFDLIVSDIDMPGMNGFELTAKIKHDKKLSTVPVILITALGSREDHERGIEVGADAYIIKSSFDQVNLLEIVRKLI